MKNKEIKLCFLRGRKEMCSFRCWPSPPRMRSGPSKVLEAFRITSKSLNWVWSLEGEIMVCMIQVRAEHSCHWSL